MSTCAQEVRLHEVLPTKSYFPAWMRARTPSQQDPDLPASGQLATPNLANTIHGSLHGGSAFAAQSGFGRAGSGTLPQPQPPGGAQPFKPPPPLDLRVLGAQTSNGWLEVRPALSQICH